MATIKQIVCPKCKAKLKFDPDKIKSEVAKFKCPGCGSVLRITKQSPQREPSLPPAAASLPEPKAEAEIKKPDTEYPDTGRKAGMEMDSGGADQDEPAASKPIAEPFSPAQKPLPEENAGPLIPADKIVVPKPAGESLLEDYDHEKLREYEEAEADADDLEWTRYADKKGPKLPESKIDLNVVPASAPGLQDTLADLQQSEMYNLQGEANLEKNHVKQAIRDFNNALAINPDYVDALVNRGSAYVLQTQYNEALKDFNHALELEKRQAEIYNIRGEIYLVNNIYDQAIKDFTAAIILNPLYSDAYLNRAKAYSEQGMNEEAESDLKQAIKAAPDKLSSFVDLSGSESLFDEEGASIKERTAKYMQQGLEDMKNNKHYEAIENFTQALNLSPDDALAYIYRGQAYVELTQADEAMVDLNRAVLFDPLNPALYYWRAMAWKALNSSINMVADLKLSCELGHEAACIEYRKHKPRKH